MLPQNNLSELNIFIFMLQIINANIISRDFLKLGFLVWSEKKKKIINDISARCYAFFSFFLSWKHIPDLDEFLISLTSFVVK